MGEVGGKEEGRHHASRCHMTQRVGPRDPHRGPTQGTHTGDPHRSPPQKGPPQGTQTGDPHRGEGPTEDPPPERRATQGTHTGPTQTVSTVSSCALQCGYLCLCAGVPFVYKPSMCFARNLLSRLPYGVALFLV